MSRGCVVGYGDLSREVSWGHGEEVRGRGGVLGMWSGRGERGCLGELEGGAMRVQGAVFQ